MDSESSIMKITLAGGSVALNKGSWARLLAAMSGFIATSRDNTAASIFFNGIPMVAALRLQQTGPVAPDTLGEANGGE
jgi:hypothetical protein